jgi:hypothetical protein
MTPQIDKARAVYILTKGLHEDPSDEKGSI